MKRCPHCNFIFPDTDELCDFDKATLVAITETEIDAKAAGPLEVRRENRRALLMATIIGISLGLILFLSYQMMRRPLNPVNDSQTRQPAATPPAVATITPAAEPSLMPAATPPLQGSANAAKPTPSPNQVAVRARVSVGPVSTNKDSGTATGGKTMIIRLASGGKVEADKVWRTKEGVWYRRDGVVTLLKPNRVKAIVNQ